MKKHWTQTARGKKKLAELRANRDSHLKGSHDSSSEEKHTIYAFSHVETWLQIYADSVGIPAPVLTSRVGDLLRRSSRRTVLGA